MAINLRRIWVTIAISLMIAAGPIAFLDYSLPHHAVLRVVGTQVKRVGKEGEPVTGPRTGARDVYYINAEEVDTKKPRVFHNEDTGWSFPWYFKFNSSDIQATAQSIAAEQGTAVITYYGWRFNVFSMYPNVLKIKRAEPGTAIIPWFNIVFFAIVIGGSLWLTFWIRGIRHRRRLAREAARGKRVD